MKESKSDKSVIGLFVAVVVVTFGLYALALSCSDAKAGQWVNIDKFRGLATHTNALNIDMSIARYCDGWFVRTDGLEKPWFTKIRGNPVLKTPTYILGQNASSDRVLLFSDNFYSMTNGVIDPVGYANTARPDSAYTLSATDSILYNWEDGHGTLADTSLRTASHWWLLWTLTTRASVNWNALDYGVERFYSNRWILGRQSTQTVQTKPMGFPIATPSVDEGSGTLDLPIDSTLIFDGSYIWVYSGDADSILNSSTTTFTMPTYADTGHVINTYESGDSLILVIDPQADAIYDTNFTSYYILWDDSLLTSHAVPCSVLSAIEYSTDSARLIVLADTTKYKPENHYHGRQNGSGAQHMFYLLYRPGTPTVYKNLGRNSSGTAFSRDSLKTTGGQTVGPIKTARWVTHAADGTQYGDLSGVADLDGLSTRITDGNVFQITTDVGVSGDDDTAFAICVGYSSTSADFGAAYSWFDFILFDTDSIKASEWGHGGNALNKIIQRPKKTDWSITTISTTTSNDRFATIHRQRGWASGNTHINSTTDKRDSTLWVRYTRTIGPSPGDTIATVQAKNYLTFPANNKIMLEGSDPVTGLSSLGQTLGMYRRRSISLLSGFAPGDFYVQPAPVGQGAANHWCIARSPLHNADVLTNENGIFFFGGGGLEPMSENIVEVLKDSINWYAESKLRASVYDNMYFVSAPFGSDTTNDRMIGIDLETKEPWLMSVPKSSGVWNFRDDDGSEQQFFGDADSTVMWELFGSTNNYYFIPEWKSSWSDLGDANAQKRVTTHRIEFDASQYTDTLYIDWYTDLLDTLNYNDTLQSVVVWTDTIPANTNERLFFSRFPSSSDYPGGVAMWTQARNLARGLDVQRQTISRPVSRNVVGSYLSFGVRGRSVSADPLTIMSYGFEYDLIQERKR